jgi:nucleoside-triphosphatase THEP1
LTGDILRRLRDRGLRVGGITQPALLEGGKRVGYLLRDERTGEERSFAHRREASEGELGYSFDPEGWSWAAQRILEARSAVDVLAVDELGRLESRGEGHIAAILHAGASGEPRVLLLSVRADCAPAIVDRVGRFDLELSIGADCSAEELADAIAKVCSPGTEPVESLAGVGA